MTQDASSMFVNVLNSREHHYTLFFQNIYTNSRSLTFLSSQLYEISSHLAEKTDLAIHVQDKRI
jgi:hypothetical protein